MYIGKPIGSSHTGCFYAQSKKAKCMTQSSTEAEYLALGETTKLVAWARSLLEELGFPQPEPTIIWEDNKSTILIVNNGNDKGRMKHIDVRSHYIRELILKKQVTIQYMPTEDMVADILTKGVSKAILQRLRPRLLGTGPDPDLFLTKVATIAQSRGCVDMTWIRSLI
jgi:hypothetical protein